MSEEQATTEAKKVDAAAEAAPPASKGVKKGIVLKDLKLANAVKIGRREAAYFNENEYLIELRANMIIYVEEKMDRPNSVYTTIMNAISWHK